MYKKSVKKYVLMVAALLLVCVVSVTGTLAYLSAKTNAVTNTFVIGDLVDKTSGKFEIREHAATYTENGVYTLDESSEVTENLYNAILPGVDVPKDPFVRITDLQVDAYLFIEVVGLDTLPDGLSGTVDNTVWEATDLPGKQTGGKVYRYVGNGTEPKAGVITATATRNDYEINVLSGEKIIVAPTYAASGTATISFYGYLIQAAGIADSVTAWGQIQ